MFEIVRDAVNQSIEFSAIDSTTGDPVTVVWNAAGLSAAYQRHAGGRPTQAAQAITLAELLSATTAHADGGLIHRADGIHRLDLPDAAVVTGGDGADRVVVTLAKTGVTFVVPSIALRHPTLSAVELAQLRYRLGIDGTTDEPEDNDPQFGLLQVQVTYGVFASVQGGVNGGTITVQEATTWTIPLTGITIGGAYERIYFTLKTSATDSDANALLQIRISQPADAVNDGLIRVNKAAASAGQRTKAEMTLTDGHPTIRVHPEIASLIASGGVWDIKVIDSAGTPYPDVQGATQGRFGITPIVTKAIS